ncbi:MAG: chromosome segregation protein SMC [Clostridia bacterium]
MLLKSIDIQGFKTFPDKTTLKFDEKMVAVVGPNGSGKSNVSDAIRWVLGEQSTRILRCSKMEDVIFKGTTKRKALGFAQVCMNIDNSDRTLNFDSDFLTISRKYYRSGESDYQINNTTVRLRDINELFMDTGLGRDGYSIIGQGKIDAIVAAKSEERREIFEEASGISRFRYKKEESERRLARAEDNLVRLRDILSELEQRVEPLRIQSEKAQKFIVYNKEKTSLEIGIWVNTLEKSSKILREHSEKTEISLAQYNEIENELENINSQTDNLDRKVGYINSQIEKERNEATSLDEETVRAEGEISVFKNDISHHHNNLDRIKEETEQANNTNQSTEQEIVLIQNKILETEKEIAFLNEQYIEKSSELENIRKNSSGISREIDILSDKKSAFNTEISNKRIQFSAMSTSISEIQNRAETIDSIILENEKNLEKTELNKSETIEVLNTISGKITALNNSVSGYLLRLKSRQEKAEKAKTEIDELNLSANENIRKARILEDLEKNLEGFSYSVKAVMKQSGRGFLSGIHGPVTNIIRTKAEFAVAIETALGASVQNIVVDNEQNAKSAISFLKKTGGGRATFLPLSVIKGSSIDTRAVEDALGFVGVASDLVECEPKYNEIKKSLLSRTIIAEDLDSATLIAKKSFYRFRIVSLDGQVVNAGGSLTGGSQNKNSGILSRKAEIETAKKTADNFSKKAIEKNAEYKKFLLELSEINSVIENIKLEITTLSQDKVRFETEIKSNEKELENLKQNEKNLLLEKENSHARISEITEKTNALNTQIQDIELELLNINSQVNNLSGNKEERQLLCETISEKMQELKLSIFSLQKDKQSFLYNLENLNKQKNDSSSLFSRLEEQQENSLRTIENLQKEIENKELFISDLKLKATEKKALITSLSAQRQECEIAQTRLRTNEKTLLSQRENVGKELARLQERMDNLQKEYDNIIKKLWDEYELTRSEAEQQSAEIDDIKTAAKRLNELKNKIRSLGSVNVSALDEYKEVKERYDFLTAQVGDVEKSKTELLKLINELTKYMQEQFAERFAIIAENFSSIFKELFGGGTASLSFSNEHDILNSGIEIKVHPPGKIVAHIEALSGGEKALVAISIYFAIMKVNPPPFCMLDEVEAALDDVNVVRFAEYLRRMNEQTQFIVITHRRGTMENADMLYGVTMQEDGISKLLAMKTEEAQEKLKQSLI